jgi:hypothetical protein
MTGESKRALSDFVRKAGASIELRPTGSGHWKATIARGGRTRFFFMSATPRASNKKQVLGDARRVLRQLSAEQYK